MHRMLGVLAALAAIMGSAAADEDAARTAEDRDALAFFTDLGFPDVADRAYVEVTTGRAWTRDGVEQAVTLRGFLLEVEEDGAFRALTDDLFLRRFVPTNGAAPGRGPVGYRRLDWPAAVRRLLAASPAPHLDLRAPAEVEPRFGEVLGRYGQFLAIAWASDRKGLKEEAHLLLDRMREEMSHGRTKALSFREGLQEEGGATRMIWRAVEAFGDTGVSRADLLAHFDRFLAIFGESAHAETAREAVEVLTRMVAEDEAHAKEAKAFEAMTRNEQIADLIFRLRDQRGGQFIQPGSPTVFFSVGGIEGENTPAHQLVRVGYDAVPHLIDALTDVRFTRTVGFWRNFTYSHYVVRIGDAALEILSSIAYRSFRGVPATREATQQRARAWWADVQAKGERQVLLDDVVRADENSAYAARVLLEKYPEIAMAAILEGLAESREERVRLSFVWLLTRDVPGGAQASVLLREMKEGPHFEARLDAAWWLLRHGHPGVVEAMAAERRHVAQSGIAGSVAARYANLFLYAGTEDALRVLAQAYEDFPPHLRRHVLQDLTAQHPRPASWPPLGETATHLLEDFLAQQMTDGTDAGWSSSGGRSVSDLRLADLAAQRLAEWWGEPAAFDMYAKRDERDRQILALTNRWRRSRGLPPSPESSAAGDTEPPDAGSDREGEPGDR